MCIDLPERLKRHTDDIDALRREMDRFILAQRVTVGVLAAAAALALGGVILH